MITKKVWNSFTDKFRQSVLEAVYMTEINYMPSHLKALVTPYKHDFNHDLSGKRLQEILKDLTLKGNDLFIVTSLPVEYN
mgnify:CR=1 FL=1